MNGSAIKAGEAFVKFFVEKNQATRDLQALKTDLSSIGSTALKAGTAVFSAGALAATGWVPAIRTFATFEQTMSGVRAVTQATESDFAKLTDLAKELGATTQFSAREAAQGMEFLGMAGFNTQQIMEGLPAVLNLAAAGGLDLGLASDIASDVGSAFQLQAAEIARVSDVLSLASASANVNVENLGEAMKFAAPAGQAAGQSIETVTAALGKLGDNALKGGIAGRNLAIVLRSLATNQSGIRELLGVEVADAAGNFRNLSDVMGDISKALELKTPIEQVTILNQLFGEGTKAVQILAGSADGLAALQEKLDNAAGAAKRIAETKQDNIIGDFTKLLSAVEAATNAGIEPLRGSIRGYLQDLTAATTGLSEFLQKNEYLSGILATATIGALGLGSALLAIGAGLKVVAFGVGTFQALQKAILASKVASMLLLEAQILLGNTLVAVLSPGGAVVLGLAAIAAGLVALQQLTGVFDPLIEGAKSLGKVLEDVLKQMEQAGALGIKRGPRDAAEAAAARWKDPRERARFRANRQRADGKAGEPDQPEAPAGPIPPKPGRRPAPPPVSDDLKATAEQIRESLKTPLQRLQEQIQQVVAANKAGLLNGQEARQAINNLRAEFREPMERQREAAEAAAAAEREQAAQEEARQRDEMAAAITEETRQRVDLARAAGDLKGELKAVSDGANQLFKAGRFQEAADIARNQLQHLTQGAADARKRYADSLESSDLVTRSASEAVSGIGTKTVDQQALEEAKKLERHAKQTRDYLRDIKRLLEE